jgi:hypothetical protein
MPSKKSNTSQTVFKHGGPHLQFHCQNGYGTMLEHQKSQESKSRTPYLVDDNWEDKQ